MTIARINNGTVTEIRDISLADVPPHKQSWWLPVVGEDQPAVGGTPVYEVGASEVTRTWVTPSLADVKAEALQVIDAQAETARLKYITSGSGQAMIYDAKQVEAREILFDPAATAAADAMDSATLKATYPMIWASIPANGATPSAVASEVQAQALAWASKGAEIEKARLDAKAAVSLAVTYEQVALSRVVSWP